MWEFGQSVDTQLLAVPWLWSGYVSLIYKFTDWRKCGASSYSWREYEGTRRLLTVHTLSSCQWTSEYPYHPHCAMKPVHVFQKLQYTRPRKVSNMHESPSIIIFPAHNRPMEQLTSICTVNSSISVPTSHYPSFDRRTATKHWMPTDWIRDTIISSVHRSLANMCLITWQPIRITSY